MIRPSTTVIAGLLALLTSPAARPQTPDGPKPPEAAVPIVVGAPATLDELIGKLADPDFVLLRGERYRELLRAMEKGASPAPAEPIVEEVAIRGRADRPAAELEIEFRVASATAGPKWVPIRLDGLVLTAATEGDRVVPLRAGAGGGWEAEVRGTGEHTLRVGASARVVAGGEERRLELAVPIAASTTLALVVAGDSAEASIGPSEPAALVRPAGLEGVRIVAALRPRAQVDVRWRVPAEQSGPLPPLVTAQGDIAVEVAPDAIQTRARWSFTSARGAAPSLALACDADEEPVELHLDGRPLPIESPAGGARRVLTIPLPEPLRPGGPARSVILITRRKTGAASRVSVRGPAPVDATILGGALAVSQSGPIWIEGEAAPGLQRIDPASDLPSDLRSRPGTTLAYRIVDRPFEVSLRVEPASPRVEARAATTVRLTPGLALTETRLTFQATPGRVFGLHFPIADGVDVEPIPADDPVESSNLAATVLGGAGRVLTVRLTSRARASGTFTLRLVTRQSWRGAGRDLPVALPWPLEATSLGGRVAVLTAPGVEATLGEGKTFRRLTAPTADEWPGPDLRVSEEAGTPAALFAYEGRPGFLPLRVEVIPAKYRAETEVNAEITRGGVSYRETVRLDVFGGRLDSFDLIVPAGVERGWTLEGLDAAARTPIESHPDGGSRYRVVLARKGVARVAFDLRYRIPFDRPLRGDAARQGRFAWMRTLPEAEGSARLSYATAPGVSASVVAPGWEERLADTPSRGPASTLERTDASAPAPEFAAKAEPMLDLPSTIVSRAFLRTVRGTDELRTSAAFRFESAEAWATIILPPGARWVRGRLDGAELSDVEFAEGADRYRFRLPLGAPSRPMSLVIDYTAPLTRGAWQPAALDGARTESSYWEVVVAGDQAILGSPRGWSDENRWRWMSYVWMKAPLLSEAELSEWAADGTSAAVDAGEGSSGRRTNLHAYLFRRSDGLAPLDVSVVSRPALVAACSGTVALAGIGLVLLRPAARPFAALALALIVVIASAADPDLALQVIPSGLLGVLLTAIAAALQWIVGRRRSAARGRFATPSAAISATTSASTSGTSPAEVGSDDSTAIRPRPPAPSGRITVATGDGPPSITESGARP